MHKWGRRLVALLLAAVLASAGLACAGAEDWRDLLRDLYGLTDDYDAGADTALPPDDESPPADAFELPVTDPQQIVNYLEIYGELPENFITKDEAKALGWDNRYNYVGEVAPGKSIGGDRFGNYEGKLPKARGRSYTECDIDFDGGYRNSKRIIFSNDGLIFYTEDHYETFEKLY